VISTFIVSVEQVRESDTFTGEQKCLTDRFALGRAGHLGKSISFFDPDRESDRRIAPELVLKLSEVGFLSNIERGSETMLRFA
jgi:hypothetical protein